MLRYCGMLSEHAPDVVHAVQPGHHSSEEFLEACGKGRVPCLATFQLVPPGFPAPARYQRLIPQLLDRNMTLCAISKQNRQLLARYYGLSEEQIACLETPSHLSLRADTASTKPQQIFTTLAGDPPRCSPKMRRFGPPSTAMLNVCCAIA